MITARLRTSAVERRRSRGSRPGVDGRRSTTASGAHELHTHEPRSSFCSRTSSADLGFGSVRGVRPAPSRRGRGDAVGTRAAQTQAQGCAGPGAPGDHPLGDSECGDHIRVAPGRYPGVTTEEATAIAGEEGFLRQAFGHKENWLFFRAFKTADT